jgi:esterase/lipase superfamily enzyme
MTDVKMHSQASGGRSLPASLLLIFFTLASLLVSCCAGTAQTNLTDIAGSVVDEAGRALAQAAVVLTNRATSEALTTKTDASGDFTFQMVPQGSYTLRAEWPRYASIQIELELSGTPLNGIKLRMYRPVAARAFPPTEEPNYYKIKVFYATDRGATGHTEPANFYGSGRDPNETLSLGTCEVSIPRDHRPGELEAPSIWRLEFHEDPEKHVVLLGVQPEAQSQFYSDLDSTIAASPNKEAFVFIHGYKTTFEDAARRTGQLAYDLNFQGAPIFYSWPSQGDLDGYQADEETVMWSTPHLMTFLQQVALKSKVKTVHLIAHSMGNRALTRVLANLATSPGGTARPHFHEVILAAPDVDRDIFKQLAGAFASSADRVTLYASSHDEALRASKKLHDFPRAGEAGKSLLILKGIDTIDVSLVDSSLLGHSYFGDNSSVISDIHRLLTQGSPPNQRACLSEATFLDLAYWVFVREGCTAH